MGAHPKSIKPPRLIALSLREIRCNGLFGFSENGEAQTNICKVYFGLLQTSTVYTQAIRPSNHAGPFKHPSSRWSLKHLLIRGWGGFGRGWGKMGSLLSPRLIAIVAGGGSHTRHAVLLGLTLSLCCKCFWKRKHSKASQRYCY